MRRYFYVDPTTGIIYLRSTLKEVNIPTFRFRVRVVDNGYPEKSDEADVVVRVQADRNAPLISGGCRNISVNEVS